MTQEWLMLMWLSRKDCYNFSWKDIRMWEPVTKHVTSHVLLPIISSFLPRAVSFVYLLQGKNITSQGQGRPGQWKQALKMFEVVVPSALITMPGLDRKVKLLASSWHTVYLLLCFYMEVLQSFQSFGMRWNSTWCEQWSIEGSFW